jgi:hypothetical protein
MHGAGQTIAPVAAFNLAPNRLRGQIDPKADVLRTRIADEVTDYCPM